MLHLSIRNVTIPITRFNYLAFTEKNMELISTEKRLTCKDLINEKFNEVEQDYKDAQKYFDELLSIDPDKQEEFKCKDKYNKFFYCEDFFDYINSNALSWDWVDAEDEKNPGYYRLQLSWGGPSDEFRIYTIGDTLDIDCINYHYMDWFDGASIPVFEDSISWDVCQMILDLEV